MLLPQEIIRKKRDGHVLSAPEISHFIRGSQIIRYQKGKLPLWQWLSGSVI